MCRCRRSPPKCAWARARVRLNCGWRGSSRAGCFLKSTASPCRPRKKRCRSLPPNCRSRRASSRALRNREVVMAEMKNADIRAMSPDQMDDAVLNLKKERFNLRFQRAPGQLENTSRLREARRDIARVKTIAAQKRAKKK